MASPPRLFHNGGLYHIYNRGVEKRSIFNNLYDYYRFLNTMLFYQQKMIPTKFSLSNFKIKDRKQPFRYALIAYIFMPNHFHLLLEQLKENGISEAISQLINSYTRYFNTHYERVGTLFQGKFKSLEITTDEQLLHIFRYIILNPFTNKLTDDLKKYQWSAYHEYIDPRKAKIKICDQNRLLNYFSNRQGLKKFILDYANYARTLEETKRLAIE